MKPIKEPGMGTVEEYAVVEEYVEQLPYAVGDQDQMQIYDAFKDCYLAGKLAGAPKWISVKERLPDIGQSVALIDIEEFENCSGDIYINVRDCGQLFLDFHSGRLFWDIRGARAMSIEAFTHWMILPPTPEEAA